MFTQYFKSSKEHNKCRNALIGLDYNFFGGPGLIDLNRDLRKDNWKAIIPALRSAKVMCHSYYDLNPVFETLWLRPQGREASEEEVNTAMHGWEYPPNRRRVEKLLNEVIRK